jgi:hypothetical protein
MTFGNDGGWEDDERGLRCAECEEGVFWEAGVGVKGVSDGDEILAARQEEEYAEFSNDDGDFECDEETRVQASIRTETGMRLAILESPRLKSGSMRTRSPTEMGGIRSLRLVVQVGRMGARWKFWERAL